jgi:hypothetical protein
MGILFFFLFSSFFFFLIVVPSSYTYRALAVVAHHRCRPVVTKVDHSVVNVQCPQQTIRRRITRRPNLFMYPRRLHTGADDLRD